MSNNCPRCGSDDIDGPIKFRLTYALICKICEHYRYYVGGEKVRENILINNVKFHIDYTSHKTYINLIINRYGLIIYELSAEINLVIREDIGNQLGESYYILTG